MSVNSSPSLLRAAAGYVFLPAVAPAAIVGLYFMPLSVIGCATRGLMAFAVAVVALLAGFAAAFRAIWL